MDVISSAHDTLIENLLGVQVDLDDDSQNLLLEAKRSCMQQLVENARCSLVVEEKAFTAKRTPIDDKSASRCHQYDENRPNVDGYAVLVDTKESIDLKTGGDHIGDKNLTYLRPYNTYSCGIESSAATLLDSKQVVHEDQPFYTYVTAPSLNASNDESDCEPDDIALPLSIVSRISPSGRDVKKAYMKKRKVLPRSRVLSENDDYVDG